MGPFLLYQIRGFGTKWVQESWVDQKMFLKIQIIFLFVKFYGGLYQGGAELNLKHVVVLSFNFKGTKSWDTVQLKENIFEVFSQGKRGFLKQIVTDSLLFCTKTIHSILVQLTSRDNAILKSFKIIAM